MFDISNENATKTIKRSYYLQCDRFILEVIGFKYVDLLQCFFLNTLLHNHSQ